MRHSEWNLECLTRMVGVGKRRNERNSCKSRESSGDMVRQFSKIRWNLREKVNAPEELPPQLVIRRFLPAFMRPFLGIYWKDFLPWYDLGESKSGPAKIWYSRERADLVRASPSSCPPVLHPTASALGLQSYMRAIFFSH